MPSTGDPRRRPSVSPPERDEFVWADQGVEAFAHEDDLRPVKRQAAPKREPLADFQPEAAGVAASPPHGPYVPSVDRPAAGAPPRPPHPGQTIDEGRLSSLARIGVSLACLAGAIAIGFGYLWRDAPESVGSSVTDHNRSVENVPWAADSPNPSPGARLPQPRSDSSEPIPGNTRLQQPRATANNVPRTSHTAAVLSKAGPRTINPAAPEPTLDASPIDTWSAFSESTAATVGADTRAAASAREPVASDTHSREEAVTADRVAIDDLLHAYEAAYDHRDVAAVAALWPSMDAAGFARAFASVKTQDLTFSACNVLLRDDRAIVECPGEIRFVRQIGGHAPQTRRAVWTITAVRAKDRWRVDDVVVR